MLKRESEGRVLLVWRRGIPISQAFTLAAKRSEHSDSPTEVGSGEMFTNINVFESPPRQGWLTMGSVKISNIIISNNQTDNHSSFILPTFLLVFYPPNQHNKQESNRQS